MTPKEKALELRDKFVTYCMGSVENYGSQRKNAKQCALIAVDEIINLLSTLAKPEYVAFIIKDVYTITDTEYGTHAHGYELVEYWQQVKEEINNL